MARPDTALFGLLAPRLILCIALLRLPLTRYCWLEQWRTAISAATSCPVLGRLRGRESVTPEKVFSSTDRSPPPDQFLVLLKHESSKLVIEHI
jgi:hypothetical protein